MAPAKKSPPKAPRSHIVHQENEDKFLQEVADYMERGFRPLQDLKIFASFDKKEGQWRRLYIMPLVHFEEFKAFQTVPTSEEAEPERMFS